jgi:GT2 family glycosyltransferase
MSPFFSLIICTYMRPKPLCNLLHSVGLQTCYPDEILIIDGSLNNETKKELDLHRFKNISYFCVNEANRGLTKQRNFGISQINSKSDIVCFLDDDTILETNYFEALLSTYTKYPEALGVGGYITNEVEWERSDTKNNPNKFYFDGYMRNEPSRFKIRQKFGLAPNTPPGFLPTFSHGRSISFLPPSGKIYEVEQLMGGVSSFKSEVFNFQKFSTYFDGYGLYEDADFTLRLSKKGKLYANTNAKLAHYHDASGRPNQFKYGKMVLRNGWYVWRVKYNKPKSKSVLKWHATALLLIAIRATNIVTSSQKKEALTETLGRLSGWFSIFTHKPKIN